MLVVFGIPVAFFVAYLAFVYIAAKSQAGYVAVGLSGVVLIAAIMATWKIAEFETKDRFNSYTKRSIAMGFEQIQRDIQEGKTELAEAKINYLASNWNHVQFFQEDGGESHRELMEALMYKPPEQYWRKTPETATPASTETTP